VGGNGKGRKHKIEVGIFAVRRLENLWEGGGRDLTGVS